MIFGLDLNVLDWNENVIVWILRMIVAAICGLAIGIERTARSKEAGIRTHTIVCLAAAIMMIVSKYAFGDLIGDAYGTKDKELISDYKPTGLANNNETEKIVLKLSDVMAAIEEGGCVSYNLYNGIVVTKAYAKW